MANRLTGKTVALTSGTAHTIEVRRSADGALIGAMRVDAAGVWSRTLVA